MGNNTGPLHGVRVIDLGRQQAGPRCPQVLARMGAEVIKIEALGGEESRYPRPWLRSRGVGWAMHNSRTPVQLNPTPSVGAHNEEVLNGLLGYSDAEVKELYSKEVIGNWDHYGETVTAKAE